MNGQALSFGRIANDTSLRPLQKDGHKLREGAIISLHEWISAYGIEPEGDLLRVLGKSGRAGGGG